MTEQAQALVVTHAKSVGDHPGAWPTHRTERAGLLSALHQSPTMRFRSAILGVKRKGRVRDGPLNHSTGRGWVCARPGKYADALSQGARVTPVIASKPRGAISPRTLKSIGHLAKRARGKGARDGTKASRRLSSQITNAAASSASRLKQQPDGVSDG